MSEYDFSKADGVPDWFIAFANAAFDNAQMSRLRAGPYNTRMAPPRLKMEITDSDPAFLSSVGMKWSEPETPLALAREKIAELESERHRRINQKSYEELMAELANPDTFDGAD